MVCTYLLVIIWTWFYNPLIFTEGKKKQKQEEQEEAIWYVSFKFSIMYILYVLSMFWLYQVNTSKRKEYVVFSCPAKLQKLLKRRKKNMPLFLFPHEKSLLRQALFWIKIKHLFIQRYICNQCNFIFILANGYDQCLNTLLQVVNIWLRLNLGM